MRYQLCNKHIQVEFESKGGMLTSLKSEGTQYLWQGDERYWGGQSPVMFPICGSIRNGWARIGDSMQCNLMRHGFARFEEFVESGQTDDTISFLLQSNQGTEEKYPYHFRFTITYQLDGKKLDIIYTVETTGQEPMPFFVGGHPGFNCPIDPGDDFADYIIEFEYPEYSLCPFPALDPLLLDINNRREILNNVNILRLNHDLFTRDALVFDNLRSRRVSYKNPVSNKGLEMEFKNFPYLVLWSSANRGPFIAIEPWLGISTCTDEDDVFEHKRNVQIVNPGEKKIYHFSIRIL